MGRISVTVLPDAMERLLRGGRLSVNMGEWNNEGQWVDEPVDLFSARLVHIEFSAEQGVYVIIYEGVTLPNWQPGHFPIEEPGMVSSPIEAQARPPSRAARALDLEDA